MTVSDTIRSIDGADSSQAAVRSASDDVLRAVPTATLIEPEKPNPSRVLSFDFGFLWLSAPP
jgi:hypothetical protein